jgi:DNA-binding NtrC family response regulator
MRIFKNVFIVEADDNSRILFGTFLARDYQVLTASNMAEAVDVFMKNEIIDLILINPAMPCSPKGKTFTEFVKERRPEQKILVLTTNPEYSYIQALNDGFSDRILVPTGGKNLRAVVQKIIEK